MRKIVFVLFAVAAIALAASCEKEIRFNGDETQSRLVLYSLARSGEPLFANISSSVFFLKNHYDNKIFTSSLDTMKGSLKVYVNDSKTPYEMYRVHDENEYEEYYYYYYASGTLRYRADYVPSPGDRIRITASFPGFDDVEGETVVPNPGRFTLSSAKATLNANGYMDYDISVHLEDDGSFRKYYAVVPLRWSSWDGGETFDKEYPISISSQDPVFQNTSSDLISIIEGETEETPYYFSDELFRGSSVDFRFSFTDFPGGAYIDYGDHMEPDPNYKVSHTLEFSTLTPSLYNHVLSMRNISYSDLGFLGESATLYSNVKGGYGCVCSSVSLSLPLNIE
ncbi:MAG: DUF4249 family protein [Bacteroidales bacterium]|nr:DUF4249 family protein [Bacteroidales bacterium]